VCQLHIGYTRKTKGYLKEGGLQPYCDDCSIPVSLSPALDTFRIGDTVLVEMNFPIEMEDVHSGDTINMADFPFNTELALVKIDTNPSTNGNNIVEYFCFDGQLNIQPLTGGGQAVQVLFAENTTSFSFACKILLKKKVPIY